MPLNPQAKKEIMLLAGLTDPKYHGKNDYYSTMEVKKSMGGIQEIPHGCVFYDDHSL